MPQIEISPFAHLHHSGNLGDEIQTIAISKTIEKLGYRCGKPTNGTRESSEGVKFLLVNAFLHAHQLKNILDNKNIKPIFSNIHINDKENVTDDMITELKKHQPIGCRDRATMQFLQAKNIEAFFNYCQTMLLDRRSDSIKGDGVIVVDFQEKIRFPRKIRKGAKYISHALGNVEYPPNVRMQMAQSLLEQYRQASLIITSRLHCALPCTAMGIPVLLFANPNDERLHLAKEILPLYPFYDYYYRYDVFKHRGMKRSILRRAYKFQEFYWKTKYNLYYKNYVNWQPECPDTEHLKSDILDRMSTQIKNSC